MHRTLRFIAAVVTAVWIPLSLSAIPDKPYPPRLVNDFAGIFSYAQRNALENKLSAFDDSTSNQIAVVTVTDLEGLSPAEYGTEIGIRWGVGSGKFDNGIVILVKPKTAESGGEVNISVGYGLEGAIPDSYAKRIIENEMIPAFRYGDYYAGIDRACTVLMKLASGEISEPSDSPVSVSDIAGGLIGILFFIFIIVLMTRRRGGGNNHGGGKRRRIMDDDFIKGLIIGNILSSGGGHSERRGGSSFGDGGGFGDFGGGDFGGGGASGRW